MRDAWDVFLERFGDGDEGRVSKAKWLTKLKVEEVSLVDRAANRRRFLLMKSQGGGMLDAEEDALVNQAVKTMAKNRPVAAVIIERLTKAIAQTHGTSPMDRLNHEPLSPSETQLRAAIDEFDNAMEEIQEPALGLWNGRPWPLVFFYAWAAHDNPDLIDAIINLSSRPTSVPSATSPSNPQDDFRRIPSPPVAGNYNNLGKAAEAAEASAVNAALSAVRKIFGGGSDDR